MNDKLFQEIVNSVKEGGSILRGETKPSREFDRTVGEPSTAKPEKELLLNTHDSLNCKLPR